MIPLLPKEINCSSKNRLPESIRERLPDELAIEPGDLLRPEIRTHRSAAKLRDTGPNLGREVENTHSRTSGIISRSPSMELNPWSYVCPQ